MSRVLVTGASGFIGRHVVKRLTASGHEVSCLIRASSNTASINDVDPRFYFGDIRDPDAVRAAVKGQDWIVHLAGLTKCRRKNDLYQVNGLATGELVRICSQLETPPKVIIVSSLAAAGPATRQRPRIESDPCRPVSEYGKSKLLGEQLAMEHGATKLPLRIVRPPIVFGEGDRAGLLLFQCIAKWGWHALPTLRHYRFSLIHAADIADAIEHVYRSGKNVNPGQVGSGIYFASDPETVTFAEYGQLIGRSVGRRRVGIMYNLPITTKTICCVNELIGKIRGATPVLNRDKAREAVAGSWACDPAALIRDTGFAPASSLISRLRQTARWYVAQGWMKPRKGVPGKSSYPQEVAGSTVRRMTSSDVRRS